MKRLNRKQILDILTGSRDGFRQAVMSSVESGDIVLECCMRAHHKVIDEELTALGGESVYDAHGNAKTLPPTK